MVLNGDPVVTANDYDQKKDVARATVAAAALAAPRERLLYLFNDTQDDRTSLEMEWERIRIKVPITVDTLELVVDVIKSKPPNVVTSSTPGVVATIFSISSVTRRFLSSEAPSGNRTATKKTP